MKRRLFLTLCALLLPAYVLSAPAGLRVKAKEAGYDPHGKRDPFIPLIGQERATSSLAFSEIVSADDARLEGITSSTSGKRMAIINGELVKEKFKAGEVEVRKIGKDSVVLAISGQEYTIKLSEEGGQK